MSRLILTLAMVLAAGVFAGEGRAGDWREFARRDGVALAIDGSGMRRSRAQLSVDVAIALLPERHLPLYGIMRVDMDCDTRAVSVKGAQFYLANGDPFGEKTGDFAVDAFTGDEVVVGFCQGEMPAGPGADSALAFFESVQAAP